MLSYLILQDWRTDTRGSGKDFICSRCGTLAPHQHQAEQTAASGAPAAAGAADSGGYTRVDHGHEDDEEYVQPLVRFWARPFVVTLEEEKSFPTPTTLKNENLLPYVQSNRGMIITPGYRFQANGVDFKVDYCHPQRGRITESTQVFCGTPISSTDPIEKVHLLPTLASLNGKSYESKELFSQFVLPMFKLRTALEAGLTQAQFESGVPLPPGTASIDCHIALGDTLMYNGVQFKVVGCRPKSGLVSRDTIVYTDGDPLPDLKTVTILPFYESLPNREKNITHEQLFRKYLEPELSGKHAFLSQSENFTTEGVEFRVVAADPPRGIVTMRTQIICDGRPLRYDEIARQQMEEDERLARELQMQEQGGGFIRPPFGMMPNIRMGGLQPGGHPRLIASLEHFVRNAPPNDPRRQQAQTILMLLNSGDPRMVRMLGELAMLERAVGRAPPPRASRDELESLPTWQFKMPSNVASMSTEEKAERLTCRICLMDYEEGDELRSLQCIHTYHRDCIDRWLTEGRNICPICKTPISARPPM